jgi:hypothetical protein
MEERLGAAPTGREIFLPHRTLVLLVIYSISNFLNEKPCKHAEVSISFNTLIC